MKLPKLKSRSVFLLICSCVLVCLLCTTLQVGMTGDENLDRNNGWHGLAYYTSGDTTFTDYSKAPDVRLKYMKYYGGAYEILMAIVVKTTGLYTREAEIRHLICALFGFLFMLFAALTARRLKGWGLASVVMLLMAVSPMVFGLLPIATKDVPLAAGFAMAIFGFVGICRTLPAFRWTDILFSILGIALAVGTRIGGLLLPFYLGVGCLVAVVTRRDLRMLLRKRAYGPVCRAVGILILIVVVGVLAGLCAYPNFFHEGMVGHIRHAFSMVSQFKQRIPMLFEGRFIDSLHLPPLYLLKSYLTTIPLFAWGGIVLFLLLAKRIWREYDKVALVLILFSLLFPPIYILLGDANFYNGWRHTLFIYSSFAIVSGIGFYETYKYVTYKKTVCYANVFLAVSAMCAVPTALWMVKNPAYCYAYYNVLVGDPYLRYDQDYFETSCQRGYEWLMSHVAGDTTITVGVKNVVGVDYQKIRGYKNVQVRQISFRGYAETDDDYTILTLNFIPANVVKYFFPPKGTIHTENIGGHSVCAVVKRNKWDSEGIRLVKTGDFEHGMPLLEKAYDYDPHNWGIWFWMGYGYYYGAKYEKAIEFFKKYVEFWPSSEDEMGLAYVLVGSSFLELKLYDQCVQTLKQAERFVGREDLRHQLTANLGTAYAMQSKYSQAIPYLEKSVQFFPNLRGLLAHCQAQIQK